MTANAPGSFALLRRILDSEAGRREAGAVICRVAAWQLWRRVVRRPMTFRSVTGTRLSLLPGASASLSGFWYQSLPDFAELVFALHLVEPDNLFVDVGANQGGWSLVLAGRGARVIAFEPVAGTFLRLQANVAANPPEIHRRIRTVPLGLGERAERVRFTAGLDAGNHRLLPTEPARGDELVVELARADDLLRLEEPVLIKIDVEGGELGVLQGAREILAKPSLLAVIMETFRPHNGGEPSLAAAEALLREHGFAPMAYRPDQRELVPLRSERDGDQNTIYVRNPAEVAARLRRAVPVRVFGDEL